MNSYNSFQVTWLFKKIIRHANWLILLTWLFISRKIKKPVNLLNTLLSLKSLQTIMMLPYLQFSIDSGSRKVSNQSRYGISFSLNYFYLHIKLLYHHHFIINFYSFLNKTNSKQNRLCCWNIEL